MIMHAQIKLHKIKYKLQNVKVLFKTDLKIEISDIKIYGKYGDMLNIPGWVADILESGNYVTIQNDVRYL